MNPPTHADAETRRCLLQSRSLYPTAETLYASAPPPRACLSIYLSVRLHFETSLRRSMRYRQYVFESLLHGQPVSTRLCVYRGPSCSFSRLWLAAARSRGWQNVCLLRMSPCTDWHLSRCMYRLVWGEPDASVEAGPSVSLVDVSGACTQAALRGASVQPSIHAEVCPCMRRLSSSIVGYVYAGYAYVLL